MSATQIIYGFHAVLAALQHHPENILTLYVKQQARNPRLVEICSQAQAQDIPIEYVTEHTLVKLSQAELHQDLAAKIRPQPGYDEKAVYQWLQGPKASAKPPLLLLLEGIQDPHNLGACLRSAEALGVDFLVIPKAQGVSVNSTVSKIACGADQSLPVVEIANMVRFINQIQSLGIWVVGTAGAAEHRLHSAALTRPVAVVMGSEGKGLKRLTLENCDEVVKIPLLGSVQSLNVSVATGICLYEVLRQRTDKRLP